MAVVDYFLKIEGVPGESTDEKHKDEIQLESFSWGETQSGRAGDSAHTGGGAGKVNMQDFHAVKRYSKASPKLMLACANGEHLKSATLVCRKAGQKQQEFLTIKMTDLLVSSYQTGGSASSDLIPTDQFSLNYAKIEFDYKPQDASGQLGGSVKVGWDLKKNVKV
jgi:type VI secretion system secreted protein Hcp